jgi:signal transduction histidine kinase
MPVEHRYQRDVLSALLKWTLIVGPPAGLLNILWSIGDLTWTTWAGSGSVLVLTAITWWCALQDRRGNTLRAARVYIGGGMLIMALVVYVAAKSEVVLAAMGLSVFVVMATFFEPKRTTLPWAFASVALYEAGLAARLLVPLADHRLPVDEISLYIVPPIVLVFFAIIGRITTHHLIDALMDSEAARHNLGRAYAEVERRVEERTRDLVQERNRLSAAMRDLGVARDQAEAASRAKSTFLATMSHELRTPLTAILGYAELIEHVARARDYADIVDDLGHISGAGQQLLGLISDVLDLSAIEAGKVEVHLEPCDVEALVGEVVGAARPLAEKNANVIQINYDGMAGVRMLDCGKVRQVLSNLLSNAAKFTERGVITITVAGDGGPEQGWLAFHVADTGIGITPERVQQLFQPFAKGGNPLERVYGGAGLGLAICQRFCDLMGGEIAATSVVGEGSIFTVRLPAAHACPASVPITR